MAPMVAHLHMVSHYMWYLTAYGTSVHRCLTWVTNMQAQQLRQPFALHRA